MENFKFTISIAEIIFDAVFDKITETKRLPIIISNY